MNQVPLSKVKRTMREVPSTGQVGGKAVEAMSSSVNLFLKDLILKTLVKSGGKKELCIKTLQKTIEQVEEFDFLRSVVVQGPVVRPSRKKRKRTPENERNNLEKPHIESWKMEHVAEDSSDYD